MIKVVREEDAQFIAHGATGKGNDQIRFELSSYALHPKIKVRHLVCDRLHALTKACILDSLNWFQGCVSLLKM